MGTSHPGLRAMTDMTRKGDDGNPRVHLECASFLGEFLGSYMSDSDRNEVFFEGEWDEETKTARFDVDDVLLGVTTDMGHPVGVIITDHIHYVWSYPLKDPRDIGHWIQKFQHRARSRRTRPDEMGGPDNDPGIRDYPER